jgi:hypothetical protein
MDKIKAALAPAKFVWDWLCVRQAVPRMALITLAVAYVVLWFR